MAIIVSNIRIGIDDPDELAIEKAKKKLSVKDSRISEMYVYKRSLDARRRNHTGFVLSVVAHLYDGEETLVRRIGDLSVAYKPNQTLQTTIGCTPLVHPIVVVGTGPAGLFAAYLLAQNGYYPLVIERGEPIEARALTVERFWNGGAFSPLSNVQFGEGGAGTFSDGKLTTRISDSRCEYILREFVRHGAPKDILTTAKPHIGTDKLRGVLVSMRKEIIRLGGQVRFGAKLDDILLSSDNKIRGVVVNGERIETEHVILAPGHSARDTFRMLAKHGVSIESKEFSVGVRIEQLQSVIDRGLYGELAGHPRLPKGEYQLSHRENGRCVYTFCMCPGGYVVPSCSEENTVVTNGMSEHARDGKNANAALVVSVGKTDFGAGLLGGMCFQESLEREAFRLAGGDYFAPAVSVDMFRSGKPLLKVRSVEPTYARGVAAASFEKLFPSDIIRMLHTGLDRFNRKLSGFSAPEGILTGPETRTSSPIRILRDPDTYVSVSTQGLYPCGEGAGYAGGIMSAACDGIRVAQAIMAVYSPGKQTRI